MGMVVVRGARAVSTCQRGRERAARSLTPEGAASSRVGSRVSSRVREPDVRMRYRTARRPSASGRAAQVSRVSHAGQVVGGHQATRGSSTPRVVSPRERGRPVTAGVRRTLGVTNGRPGVPSPLWRAPTRRPACTPAWTRRARGAAAPRPRSATSTSPACTRGGIACPWAKSWVSGGATASVRSPPVPSWQSPRRSSQPRGPPPSERPVGVGRPKLLSSASGRP
jgi:hypothetical protein